MVIENLTQEKYPLCETDGCYTINYGAVKKGTDMTVDLLLKSKLNIQLISAESSCGCTTPEAAQKDEKTIEFKIKYNSQLLGSVSKKAWVNYKVTGQPETLRTTINLKGVVTV